MVDSARPSGLDAVLKSSAGAWDLELPAAMQLMMSDACSIVYLYPYLFFVNVVRFYVSLW